MMGVRGQRGSSSGMGSRAPHGRGSGVAAACGGAVGGGAFGFGVDVDDRPRVDSLSQWDATGEEIVFTTPSGADVTMFRTGVAPDPAECLETTGQACSTDLGDVFLKVSGTYQSADRWAASEFVHYRALGSDRWLVLRHVLVKAPDGRKFTCKMKATLGSGSEEFLPFHDTCTSVSDLDSNVVRAFYDDHYSTGRLDKIVDALGRTVRFGYGGQGLLERVWVDLDDDGALDDGELRVEYGYVDVAGRAHLEWVRRGFTSATREVARYTYGSGRSVAEGQHLLESVTSMTGAVTSFDFEDHVMPLGATSGVTARSVVVAARTVGGVRAWEWPNSVDDGVLTTTVSAPEGSSTQTITDVSGRASEQDCNWGMPGSQVHTAPDGTTVTTTSTWSTDCAAQTITNLAWDDGAGSQTLVRTRPRAGVAGHHDPHTGAGCQSGACGDPHRERVRCLESADDGGRTGAGCGGQGCGDPAHDDHLLFDVGGPPAGTRCATWPWIWSSARR